MKVVALVIASLFLLALPSCATSKSSAHACSDKVAQSITTFKKVSGLWNCLSPSLQSTLHSYGLQGDGAFVPTDGSTSTAVSYQYVGSHGDMDVYVVILKPDTNGHVKTLAVVIWTDTSGKVSNIGVGAPAF